MELPTSLLKGIKFAEEFKNPRKRFYWQGALEFPTRGARVEMYLVRLGNLNRSALCFVAYRGDEETVVLDQCRIVTSRDGKFWDTLAIFSRDKCLVEGGCFEKEMEIRDKKGKTIPCHWA